MHTKVLSKISCERTSSRPRCRLTELPVNGSIDGSATVQTTEFPPPSCLRHGVVFGRSLHAVIGNAQPRPGGVLDQKYRERISRMVGRPLACQSSESSLQCFRRNWPSVFARVVLHVFRYFSLRIQVWVVDRLSDLHFEWQHSRPGGKGHIFSIVHRRAGADLG